MIARFARTPTLAALVALGLALGLIAVVPVRADTQNTQPWQQLSDIPGDPDTQPGSGKSGRTEGACTALMNNKIFVAFGFDPQTVTSVPPPPASPVVGPSDTRSLRIYDIHTNSWLFGPKPPPGTEHSEGYRGVANNTKLYCVGDNTPTATISNTWLYNPAQNTWTGLAPRVPPTAGTTAASYANNIFVFGGRASGSRGACSSPATPLSPAPTMQTIKRYDIDKNMWFDAGNLVMPRSDATAARVGGLIYIFGGCDGSTKTYNNLEIYDPRTQTSILGTTFPDGLGRAGLAAADPQSGSAANNSHQIHITGGSDYTIPPIDPMRMPNHLIYDVDRQAFVPGVDMPRHCDRAFKPANERGQHELVYGGDRIYAVGGACGTPNDAINTLDVQMLSGPPAPPASLTAASCNNRTFPACPVQPAGISGAFVTGTGYTPASTVNLVSSLQGPLPPAVADTQGQFSTTYVDTKCTGQRDTITGTDSGGRTASASFTCP